VVAVGLDAPGPVTGGIPPGCDGAVARCAVRQP
jgi:hypothetical protein